MALKRSYKIKTGHLRMALYTSICLITILSEHQIYSKVQTKTDLKNMKMPWIHESIVYSSNFYNIDENDRLEKRSISKYTYENNVKTNGVPKFTYILPKNTINVGANVMQINKKTGTVNENMGYSSIRLYTVF